MRRVTLVVCLILVSLIGMAQEGTILYGVKFWYNFWDSAGLRNFETALTEQIPGSSLDSPAGRGYMLGPLFGYQAPSQKWSASLALMILSGFEQDFSGTVGGLPIDASTTLERQDYDLAFTYTVLRYFRLYAGYKHLIFEISYKEDSLSVRNLQTGVARMPTVGAGFAYPLTPQIGLGAQMGIRYTFWKSESEILSTGFVIEDDVDNSFGVVGEATVSYFPRQNLLVQIGYRYDWIRVVSQSGGQDFTTRDISHGPSVTVLFLK